MSTANPVIIFAAFVLFLILCDYLKRTMTAADIASGIALRETFREALEEIADQKTSDEIEADHKALIDDYGAHDFEAGYDTAIRKARAALGRSNIQTQTGGATPPPKGTQ